MEEKINQLTEKIRAVITILDTAKRLDVSLTAQEIATVSSTTREANALATEIERQFNAQNRFEK